MQNTNGREIWLLQIGEPLPVRDGVRKQRMTLLMEKLSERGHKVVRWGSTFDHITKTHLSEVDSERSYCQNTSIRMIKGLGYKKNVSLRRYLDHRLIARKFYKQAMSENKPDAIVVATPPHHLAYQAVRYGKEMGVPVIVDIRDQWPDMIVDLFPRPLRAIAKLAMFREYNILKYALRSAVGVTSMMRELFDWGLAHAGRDENSNDGVFFIGSKVADEVDESTLRPEFRALLDKISNSFTATYVGTFNKYYNPTIMVDVARRFESEGIDGVNFVLAGDGGLYESVRKAAKGLRNVHFTGWLKHEEIMALLKKSSVGIMPLNEDFACFPNKAFIYLSAYLPIITSTKGDLEEAIEDYGIGAHFQRGDRGGLYTAIRRYCDDPQLLLRTRNNVKDAFHKYYEANKIYDSYSSHIENVIQNYRDNH
jgi:glycosyltransferase involved in cell wall biosynthesis